MSDGTELRPGTVLPPVKTWRLMEALSLLCLVLRADEAEASVIEVFGKTGPHRMVEDGVTEYIWAQATLSGDRSGLNARPDLIVTSTPAAPQPSNAIRIVDAKCVRDFGTQAVRSEFGKGHDLRVAAYLIWTFYTPAPRVVAGARRLGIDIEVLGFDTDRRGDLVRDPAALISRVAHAQEQSRKAHRFAGSLLEAGEETRRKLLGPAR
jgi:hypothetical protein